MDGSDHYGDRLKGTSFESRPFIDTKAAGERNSPAAFSRFPLLKHILHIGDTIFFGTKSAYLQSPQGRLFAAEKGGDAQ